MAVRFYMPSSGAAPISPAVDAAWERSASVFFRAPSPTVRSNTTLTDKSALFGATTTSQTCWAQFITDTLDLDQLIGGTVSMVIRGLEFSLSEDLHLAFNLWVVTPTLTNRGTLKLQHATATEYAVTAETRIFNAITLTATNCSAGDRLVMEVGMHGVTPANGGNNVLRFGDQSATADFALTSGLTTDLNPWWSLSQNVTFGAPVDAFPLPGGHSRRRRNIQRGL
jgi:hypothetical protein